MDLKRLRPADWLTGLAGVALFVLLYAPWYDVRDGYVNAWESFALVDAWFVLTAVLAVGVLVSTAVRDTTPVPLAFAVVTATVAAVAVVLAVVRLLAIPGGKAIVGRDWGLYVGALAVLGVFAGAWWALRDERAPHTRRAPEARTFTVPAAGAGPRPADS